MLLHTAQRGGKAGERELRKRISMFDAGQWTQLLAQSRAQSMSYGARLTMSDEARIAKAMTLIEEGEMSHAARALQSAALAPGTQATLHELTDPRLRPQSPEEPIPEAAIQFESPTPFVLDRQVFADVLRQCRKGLSSGILGNRYEYLKICLEDDIAFNALYEVADLLAGAKVPTQIVDAMRVSAITALVKPNSRIRGISAADTFRRLVTKTVVRQKQDVLRQAVWPNNFGLSNRSGTDCVAHMIQYLSDEDPSKVTFSIDGVGAFDHVSRARIFESLLANPDLHDLIPFVRQWYA